MFGSIGDRLRGGRDGDETRPLLGRQRRSDPTRAAFRPSSGEEEDYQDEQHSNSDGMPDAPILPIFSSAHLDKIPIYHLQHSIRLHVVQKCETTLSWDQLRSPQISQFLVKPLQQQIYGNNQNSRGTLYALISNCLQFEKEGQSNPGIVGVSRTRALLCELIAMRILKDSSTHELIDALFYDFDPLQGFTPPRGARPYDRQHAKTHARISCVEIAIRAQAKRFLAHPLVVQQLEAIWAGNIVFHSVADHLHRKQPAQLSPRKQRGGSRQSDDDAQHPIPAKSIRIRTPEITPSGTRPSTRRSVTLYDPSQSSIFKLSRLRVPRYRQLFSTLSYGVMLVLFLAVLMDRSLDITALEILFWFWSAGYMLDEVVGFSEQGFGLYIMSFWNVFDIGILLCFIGYYVLRLYGILMPDVRKRPIANLAYDVLASTAVLLFPRLFSVLDHYRYFSQLLIAFRMMAVDLVAILILIVISCSGFFVAFTLSFSDKDFDASAAAYALFQIIMGFTPAAWELWPGYNLLGKTIMAIFLIICHFMIVTILITVLTNSFMAIVRNANEEHQFLFAINTISMVKSDALFSYIPPTNILAWLLAPLRWILPFRTFVRLNRTIIKITHLPVLFAIFVYERMILARLDYEPEDFIEQRGRQPSRLPTFAVRAPTDLFSPGMRVREPSVTTFYKDRALDEVFRQPLKTTYDNAEGTGRRSSMFDRRRTSNVVQTWMRGMESDGAAAPVDEQGPPPEEIQIRRPNNRRMKTAPGFVNQRRDFTRVTASDPGEDAALATPISPKGLQRDYGFPSVHSDEIPQQTDADGDDELATNDDDDRHTYERSLGGSHGRYGSIGRQDKASAAGGTQQASSIGRNSLTRSHRPGVSKSSVDLLAGSVGERRGSKHQIVIPPPGRANAHNRTTSSATILFSPLKPEQRNESASSGSAQAKAVGPQPGATVKAPTTGLISTKASALASSSAAGGSANTRRQPPRSSTTFFQPAAPASASKPRPIKLSDAQKYYSSPNLAAFLQADTRKPSFNAMALDLASDLGDNQYLPDSNIVRGLPASFGTQAEISAWADRYRRSRHDPMAAGSPRRQRRSRDTTSESRDSDREAERKDTSNMMNRMMIERMTNLEAGFKEVLREVKRVSRAGSIDDDLSGSGMGLRGAARGNFGAGAGGGRHIPRRRGGGLSSANLSSSAGTDRRGLMMTMSSSKTSKAPAPQTGVSARKSYEALSLGPRGMKVEQQQERGKDTDKEEGEQGEWVDEDDELQTSTTKPKSH